MEEVKTTTSNKQLIKEIAKTLGIKDAKCVGETDDTLTFAGEDSVSGATLKVVINNIIVKRFAPVEISVCDASEEAKSVKTEVELSSEKVTAPLEEDEEEDDDEEDYDDDEEEDG